jgi:hypothetical protein
LSGSQQTAITTALSHHERVVATIHGAIIDLSGEIVGQTVGKTLTITG